MKYFCFLLVILLSACNTTNNDDPEQQNVESAKNKISSTLPVLGQAPELTNDIWINSQEPLRLENLKGKVVLLEMWTFG